MNVLTPTSGRDGGSANLRDVTSPHYSARLRFEAVSTFDTSHVQSSVNAWHNS